MSVTHRKWSFTPWRKKKKKRVNLGDSNVAKMTWPPSGHTCGLLGSPFEANSSISRASRYLLLECSTMPRYTLSTLYPITSSRNEISHARIETDARTQKDSESNSVTKKKKRRWNQIVDKKKQHGIKSATLKKGWHQIGWKHGKIRRRKRNKTHTEESHHCWTVLCQKDGIHNSTVYQNRTIKEAIKNKKTKLSFYQP